MGAAPWWGTESETRCMEVWRLVCERAFRCGPSSLPPKEQERFRLLVALTERAYRDGIDSLPPDEWVEVLKFPWCDYQWLGPPYGLDSLTTAC